MKPTTILINTCRGPVVDEEALYDALVTDRIRGAGLDVMVEEPPAPEHKLFTLPNIILTPHMAGPSWENWKKAFRNSFDNIERVARGEKPLWVLCHEHHRSKRRCGTVREMKEGPSGSAIRSLIPSHRKLLWSKVTVVSVAETPGR